MDAHELLESIKDKRNDQGIGEMTDEATRKRFDAWSRTPVGRELCSKVSRWHAASIFAAGDNWRK